MLVVADTTPINDLVLIGQVTILAALYKQVVIPSAVATELRHRSCRGGPRPAALAIPDDAPGGMPG